MYFVLNYILFFSSRSSYRDLGYNTYNIQMYTLMNVLWNVIFWTYLTVLKLMNAFIKTNL